MARPLALAFLAAGALAAPACVIAADSSSSISGTYVSQTTLDQIEPGKDREYVRALLGEPDITTRLDDGSEIWKWHYVEKKRSHGHLIFVFDSDSNREIRHTAFVEFGPDGKVVKAWRD
ncbi:MAG: outer membrane protein assembly factor BamE [Planctomycetota bacterium]|nr:MAG: outer membrane protein assembly factor BamE [Planctomycetota bacterium]